MPRPKKPTYEWVASRGYYRKRIKGTDGRYVSVYARTVPELEAKLADAQAQLAQEDLDRQRPTVEQYALQWLEHKAAHVRENTMGDYRYITRHYIIAPLGGRRMDELTPDDIEAAIAPAARMSASVYHKTQMLYKAIFESARRSGILTVSPCEDLSARGGTAARARTALTDQQVFTLLEAVRGLDVHLFIVIALYTGLRREEILALQWDCVHLYASAPHLDVRRAWRIEHNRPIVSRELKSPAAYRTIPLPPQLVRCLRDVPRESDYVISRTGGPLSGSQWKAYWEQVIKRSTKVRTYTRYHDGKKEKHTVCPQLGEAAPHNPDCVCRIDFEVTPHILRHTYISRLIMAGVDLKTVQYLAGHEDAKITMNIYTHIIYNSPEDLISKVTGAFGNDSV